MPSSRPRANRAPPGATSWPIHVTGRRKTPKPTCSALSAVNCPQPEASGYRTTTLPWKSGPSASDVHRHAIEGIADVEVDEHTVSSPADREGLDLRRSLIRRTPPEPEIFHEATIDLAVAEAARRVGPSLVPTGITRGAAPPRPPDRPGHGATQRDVPGTATWDSGPCSWHGGPKSVPDNHHGGAGSSSPPHPDRPAVSSKKTKQAGERKVRRRHECDATPLSPARTRVACRKG